MSLTSEQAKAISARPRIPPEVEERACSMYAEGASDAEVHERFPTWAEGSFRNLRGRKKAEINDLRRARTVQFSDIPRARKQARLDDYSSLVTTAVMLLRKHLESCYAADPVTGEVEFVEQLVDSRKFKTYSEAILKADKMLMIETGQQVRLDDKWAVQALGLDGHNGIDYPAIVAATPAREAEEKWNQLEEMRRDIIDHDWKLEALADKLQARGYILTAEERGEWLRLMTARAEAKSPVEARNDERQLQQIISGRGRGGQSGVEGICAHVVAKDPPVDVEGVEKLRVMVKQHVFPYEEAAHKGVDAYFDRLVHRLVMEKVMPGLDPGEIFDEVPGDYGDDDDGDDEAAPEPEPEPEPLEPPPGFTSADGEWVREWVDD